MTLPGRANSGLHDISLDDGSTGAYRVLAVVYCLLVSSLLAYALWRTPMAISDTIGFLLELVGERIFDVLIENYINIRPGIWLVLGAVWSVSPDPETAFLLYRILHIVNVLALILFFFLIAKPVSSIDLIAVTVALACLLGLASFRSNLEATLLSAPMIIMAFSAYAMWALQRRRSLFNDLMAVGGSILMVFVKEPGLSIPVIYIIGYVLGFRGVHRVTVALLLLFLVLYVALRIATAGDLPVFGREIGFLFDEYDTNEARARFGGFPLPIYLYNVLATVSNTLFSEPTRGTFSILGDFLNGKLQFWQANAVLSSLCATLLIFFWGGKRLLAARWSDDDIEWRIFVIFIIGALGVSSVLGFNYTRDRFGGVSGVFYALSLYYATRYGIGFVLSIGSQRVFLLSLVAVFLFASSWQLRAVGTAQFVRELAWSNRKEWIMDYHDLKVELAGRPHYVPAMDLLYDQGIDTTVPNTQMAPRFLQNYLGSFGR